MSQTNGSTSQLVTNSDTKGRIDVTNSMLAAQLAHDVRTYERVTFIAQRHLEAQLSLDNIHASHTAQRYTAQSAAVYARGIFARDLVPVYRDPAQALHRFESLARSDQDRAVELLATRPETFGTLRRVETPRLFGLFSRAGDETPARQAAHTAAVNAVTMLQRQAEARIAPLESTTLREAQRTVSQLSTELRSLPSKETLSRGMHGILQHISPVEMKQVQKLLTPAQNAIFQSVKASVREVMLGTDGRER